MEKSVEKQKIDSLISGCDVLSMDARQRVIRNGAIAVKGNRIHWVGKADEAKTLFAPSSHINGSDKLALPGMIDAHFHTAQHLLRGKIVSISRQRPLKNPVWRYYYLPFESILEPEDVYLSGMLAYTNMISLGTTCFFEAGGPHPDEMGRAALDSGIRGIVSLSTMDSGLGVPDALMMSSQEALDRNVDLVKRWRQTAGEEARVSASLSLRQLLVCSPTLVEAMGQAARDLDVKIHTHLSQGGYEVDYCLQQHGMRPAEYLAELGVLNRHLHCAHSLMLSHREMDLYVEHMPSVCHCAFNNYAMGQPPLVEMWRRGIDVGLGTDGAATWGTLDMFRVAHAASIGQQALAGTPRHMRAPIESEDLLKMASHGGARALGMEQSIGSLEVGKKADIVLLDAGHMDQLPLYDPLFSAASTSTGQDVSSVMIDGKMLMKDRELQCIDLEKLKADLAQKLPDIMARFDRVMG